VEDDAVSVASTVNRRRPAAPRPDIEERVKAEKSRGKGKSGGKASRNDSKDREKRRTAAQTKKELNGTSAW
jgi:hypothetical protein